MAVDQWIKLRMLGSYFDFLHAHIDGRDQIRELIKIDAYTFHMRQRIQEWTK